MQHAANSFFFLHHLASSSACSTDSLKSAWTEKSEYPESFCNQPNQLSIADQACKKLNAQGVKHKLAQRLKTHIFDLVQGF